MISQNTESGSSSNTMAKTIHDKLQNLEGTLDLEWNYQTMTLNAFAIRWL
ncbi:hypothetical protein VP01_12490g1 [Puccinia sorghi]|uniref:Uncharacterized protein n=1 Tax=Puccinia sorghi TaxID=27349 RepID=A0A0L6VQZ3_9BASI|nr:hypothetical protein VP01_12490g1 [Puccinia sorghi]